MKKKYMNNYKHFIYVLPISTFQANEIDYNQPNNIRPDFELSNLLNANHIEDSGTLDDIEFPDTSLEFEDMADYTTSTRRNSGSKLETKPVVLSHVKTSNR